MGPSAHEAHVVPPAPATPPAALAYIVVAVEGGHIFYFRSNGNFEARCGLHEGRCALTRKARPRQARAGRPVGLMAAWLRCGAVFGCKADHVDKDIVAMLGSARERAFRQECRRAVREAVGGVALLAEEEGEKGADGESEPETSR